MGRRKLLPFWIYPPGCCYLDSGTQPEPLASVLPEAGYLQFETGVSLRAIA